jgi:hypothetical protein
LYGRRTEADNAVQTLLTEGFSRDQISVVAPDSAEAALSGTPKIAPIETLDTDTGKGAAIGGIAGFVGGLAALAIPGIGPVLAAGPLAAGLMGAGLGAAAGGIAGALKSHGIPEHDAERYSAEVGRGGCLVLVHADIAEADRAAALLDRSGAVQIDERDEKAGSSTSPAPRLTPDAIEAAKLKPGEGVRDRQKLGERRAAVYPGITGGGPTPAT